jgi:nucleoside-diphosphate-sugar epimerase
MSQASVASEFGSILVTGGTGVLGTELTEVLASAGWRDLVAVGRRRATPGMAGYVAWDIGREGPPPLLRRHWDVVVNAAADTRWTMSPEEANRANVITVDALRSLVGPQTHLIHISTAYAGGLEDDVWSDDLGDYRNTYEWSKARAERRIREGFPNATIVRPTLIIGRRSDGRVARFSGMYILLRGLLTGSIPLVVSTPSSRVDIIPVDDLAEVVAAIAAAPRPDVERVITVAAGDAAPGVGEMLENMVGALNLWRRERARPPLALPRIVSPDSWQRFFLPFADELMSARQRQLIELLRVYEPYLQMEDPLLPTHQVEDVGSCLAGAVRYWAKQNSGIAALSPRPWRAVKALGEGASTTPGRG